MHIQSTIAAMCGRKRKEERLSWAALENSRRLVELLLVPRTRKAGTMNVCMYGEWSMHGLDLCIPPQCGYAWKEERKEGRKRGGLTSTSSTTSRPTHPPTHCDLPLSSSQP